MEESGKKVTSGLPLLMVGFVTLGAPDLAILAFLTPKQLGGIGVTSWFVLTFLWMCCLFGLVLYVCKTFLKVSGTKKDRLRYSRRQGMLIASWVVTLGALMSLRQLSVQDVVITGLLIILIELYVRLRWP